MNEGEEPRYDDKAESKRLAQFHMTIPAQYGIRYVRTYVCLCSSSSFSFPFPLFVQFGVDLADPSHLVELLPAHVATDDAYRTIQSAQVDFISSRQYRRALLLRLATFVRVLIVTYMSRAY